VQAAEEPAEQGTGDRVAEPVVGVGRPNATMNGGAPLQPAARHRQALMDPFQPAMKLDECAARRTGAGSGGTTLATARALPGFAAAQVVRPEQRQFAGVGDG
jgi:hypothetical protein